MKLIIDTRNGIAGDIVCAGLIGLGADQEQIAGAMEKAGNRIGSTRVLSVFNNDVVSLDITLSSDLDFITESQAKEHLAGIMEELELPDYHRRMGKRILVALCEAEKHVHATDPRLEYMLQHHNEHPPHHHLNQKHHHEHPLHYHPSKKHYHEHPSHPGALLHEAQDILCDISGFLIGLQLLNINEVHYLDHVNVGAGNITFSHGTFPVPAPATCYLLEQHGIIWKRSEDHSTEMTTPTGASILVGSEASRVVDFSGFRILKQANASGTRKGLPPVTLYLAE